MHYLFVIFSFTTWRLKCGIERDVGIIDCYRYYKGIPYLGALPIIVEFKARREKEQLLWRSKDRLRHINVVVTDDIALRQNVTIDHPNIDQPRQHHKSDKTTKLSSPKKKEKPSASAEQEIQISSPKKNEKPKASAEQDLFGDFF